MARIVPVQKLCVVPRDDDYFFGVLQSRAHELWALSLGSTLEDRPSYNADTTFSTFPFPWTPGKEPRNDLRADAIVSAARELTVKRDGWLNPPDAKPEILAKRTLTNLYNERPTWLADAHRALDKAVFAAYGWPATLTDAEIVEHLLTLNHQRAAQSKAAPTGKSA